LSVKFHDVKRRDLDTRRKRERGREAGKGVKETARERVSCFGNRGRDLRYLHSATFAPYVVPFRHCPNPASRTLIDVPTSSLTLLLRFPWHLYFAAGRYQVTIARISSSCLEYRALTVPNPRYLHTILGEKSRNARVEKWSY